LISQTIARRYAQALLSIGREDGRLSLYGEELAAFTRAAAMPELLEALINPIYPAENRRVILEKIMARLGLSKIVSNFIGLLQDKGRIGHIAAINEHYQRMMDEVNNIKRATIITATGVGPEVRDQVKSTLEKLTGKTIVLEAREDPEIIGGLIAKVGDLTLDGSVKSQLKNLKESLIKG
jgi:F-type H+-transporting ATPase subunit delta